MRDTFTFTGKNWTKDGIKEFVRLYGELGGDLYAVHAEIPEVGTGRES